MSKRKRDGEGGAAGAGGDLEDGAGAGSAVIVQFQTMEGDSTGPQIELPVGATTKQLEQVLHSVLGESGGATNPYSFYVEEAEVVDSLQAAIADQRVSTEVVLPVRYQPLAVFRVLPVTRCTDSLPGHTDSILHVSFSPTGRVLASGGGDGTVRFWDTMTCTPKHRCPGHRHHVLCTAWAPNGVRFASGDRNGEVRVWDPAKGALLATLTGHKAWVTSLAWEPFHVNPACERLASSSKDGTVRIWNVRTGRFEYSLSGHADSVESVKWGGEGLVYTASRDRNINVWATKGTERAKLVRTLKGHAHRINTLALSTDHPCRTGPFDHTGRAPADPAEAMEAARKRYDTVLAATGGKELLVSGSDDFTLFLWDPANAKAPIARMTGHQQLVNHLSFSPDARYIASASFDKKVKLWAGSTGKFLITLTGHVGAVYHVCWASDSRYLASASKDSTCKVWAAGTASKGKALFTLAGHADEVYALDWAPNGEKLASGSKDRILKIWRH